MVVWRMFLSCCDGAQCDASEIFSSRSRGRLRLRKMGRAVHRLSPRGATAPKIPRAAAISASAAAAISSYSTSFLSAASDLNLALVILNVDRPQRDLLGGCDITTGATARFSHLWRQSSLRLCADGAANRLHDSLGDAARAEMLPDLITGDLDSLRGDVATFYTDHGVPIESVPDQDSHDFEKCLQWLERKQADEAAASVASGATPKPPFSVVAVGAFGGRLDQQMANLNMAFSYKSFANFYLLSESSLAFVLPPGKHTIETNTEAEDGSCGLIPLGGRCERVVTTGLKWNLDGERPLEFGSLISSSNELVEPLITVETDSPLLWTTGLKDLCVAACCLARLSIYLINTCGFS